MPRSKKRPKHPDMRTYDRVEIVEGKGGWYGLKVTNQQGLTRKQVDEINGIPEERGK